MTNNRAHPRRSTRIDILRGLAVMGMIVAHGLFFLHDKSGTVVPILENFLNTVVLTAFVFVFGMAWSKWLDTHTHSHIKRLFLLSLKRAGVLYVVYAATSCVAVFTASDPSNRTLSSFVYALVLISPPNFTEYIPLFILIVLLLPLLRPLVRATCKSALLTFITGAFSYLLGITIYNLHTTGMLTGIKALFAGSPSLLRFPVLFYLPVALWGLWWQHQRDRIPPKSTRTNQHLLVLTIGVLTTISGMAAVAWLHIPILDPATRWPPSVTFLTLGMSVSAIMLTLMPSFAFLGNTTKHVLSYVGRDAYELWANHLILLFLYRRFIGVQFTNPLLVAALIAALIITAILLSSIRLTNNISFPFSIAFHGRTRAKKRHALVLLTALILLVWPFIYSSQNPYGNVMQNAPLTIEAYLPETTSITLSSEKIWHVRNTSEKQTMNFSVSLTGIEFRALPKPDRIRISLNDDTKQFEGVRSTDGIYHYTLPVSDVAPGIYSAVARIENKDVPIVSEPVTIHVTEPLYVAWTFDWEGWDTPDEALSSIDSFAANYPFIKFSHFVNPRTFLPNVLSQERAQRLKEFLLIRRSNGDEIGLHLHMHYDLVEAAGVTPKKTHAWGLRTEEGYDIPTTEYTAEEFQTIVSFAQALAEDLGFPVMHGYRAGGWFINTEQLNVLPSLGFVYDSSARSKTLTGAFRTTPWALTDGAQPYYPSQSDQNTPVERGPLLEIPINGLSTYDQDIETLTKRVRDVYTGGILTEPKALVFVSHPQFFAREFEKIPTMLTILSSLSNKTDRGPVVFSTTFDIYQLWSTLPN